MSSSDNINSDVTTSTTNSDTGTNNYFKIRGLVYIIPIVGTALIALIALIAGIFISKKNKKEDNKTTFDKDGKDIKTNIAGNNLDETKKTNEVKL